MAHEEFGRHEPVDGSSNRSFGLVFAVVFLIIAGFPLFNGGAIRWWSVGTAAGFALIALARPTMLGGLNRLWTRFGILLGKLVSPLALGILFYGVFTPIGALMRLKGKDPLLLKFDRGADSYWIQRVPPGPPPDSMNNQF